MDQAIVGVSAAYAEGAFYVTNIQLLAGHIHPYRRKVINAHHFFRSDIDRTCEVRICEPPNTLHALIDEEKRARLCSVAPNLDLSSFFGLRNFAAHCTRR